MSHHYWTVNFVLNVTFFDLHLGMFSSLAVWYWVSTAEMIQWPKHNDSTHFNSSGWTFARWLVIHDSCSTACKGFESWLVDCQKSVAWTFGIQDLFNNFRKIFKVSKIEKNVISTKWASVIRIINFFNGTPSSFFGFFKFFSSHPVFICSPTRWMFLI